ncbi:MAG: GNAT family N-acetyltransferase [Actinomycetota bacterium]|nr:GNAT family N-acetyltransferase [Actinomycetota bacterium]
MQALVETDVHSYAARVLPWVAREPVLNNVLASNVEAVRDGRRSYDGALWLTVVEGDEIVGVAHHTPPYGLLICPMPPTAARVLAHAVAPLRPDLSGVNGVSVAAEAFASAWGELTGVEVLPGMAQLLYETERIVPPADVPGRARVAAPADHQLVLEWSLAFHAEAVPDQPTHSIEQSTVHRIADGELLIWQVDGRPVSFAGASTPSAGVARIGPVYTPPADRRQGFGAAVTASASQRALDDGARQCMLYTDAANPTSNSIYQQIGYRLVGDARQFAFASGR